MKTKTILYITGVIVGLILYIWIFDWAVTPVQVTSVENVRKQWAFAYNGEASLKAAAQNVCIARKAMVGAQGEVLTQRQSQELALEQNYNRIASDYDGQMRDAFQAKLVAPNDVPKTAPDLTTAVGLWCN